MLGAAGATFRASSVCQGWAVGPVPGKAGRPASFRLGLPAWRSSVPNLCSIRTRWP